MSLRRKTQQDSKAADLAASLQQQSMTGPAIEMAWDDDDDGEDVGNDDDDDEDGRSHSRSFKLRDITLHDFTVCGAHEAANEPCCQVRKSLVHQGSRNRLHSGWWRVRLVILFGVRQDASRLRWLRYTSLNWKCVLAADIIFDIFT